MTRGCFRCVSWSKFPYVLVSQNLLVSHLADWIWPLATGPGKSGFANGTIRETHHTPLASDRNWPHWTQWDQSTPDTACTANRSKKDCKLNKCPGEQVHISNYWRNTASLCSSSTRLSDFSGQSSTIKLLFSTRGRKNICIPLRQSQTSHPKQAFSSKRPCLNPHFCSVTCQPCVTICYPSRIVVDTSPPPPNQVSLYIPKTSLLNLELAGGNIYIYNYMYTCLKCIYRETCV